MLEIYFESDKEAISFCEELFQYNKQIELHWKATEKLGNHLEIINQTNSQRFNETAARVLVHVFMTHRITRMIRKVIRSNYYYSNTDEIERIMDLSHWIILNDDTELSFHDSHPKDSLYSLFLTNIQHSDIIHFDSIIQFQLEQFKEDLIYYVGFAIDEFKREEDHQAFIDMLRHYVKRRTPLMDTLYVLQGEPFTFYRPDGRPFSVMELRTLMQREPLYITGLDSDELNLAPLITIAPHLVKIYGDDPSEPKTMTVINIFQERAEFSSLNHFPFSLKSNRSG